MKGLQHVDDTVAHVTFGSGGNADSLIGTGWSPAEAGFRWMVDAVSEFWLDGGDFESGLLALDLHPYVAAPALPAQRVVIKVEGAEVYRAELSAPVGCEVPLRLMAPPAAGRIHVTIEHPDAISPMELTGQNDQRRLAFAIREARLYRPATPDRESDIMPAAVLSAPAVIIEPARLSTVVDGFRRQLPNGRAMLAISSDVARR